MEDIKVYVVKFQDRDNFAMKYTDPHTGQNVRRSTGTTKRREADKIAAKWEAELQEGRYQKRSRMSWDEFCDRYELDGTGGLKPSTVVNYFKSLHMFGQLCHPRKVSDLTTGKITAFARELRKPYGSKGKKTRSEATVACHLRQLKVVCRWANRQGYLATVPAFAMPKGGAKRMKGRPITLEEFERMLAATPKVVGDIAADSWKLLLCGLWWSGLRLGEAMTLRWDQQPDGVCVMLNGQKSVLAFDADSQKSGKVQLVPLAPEAVELLEPLQELSGYVFTPRRTDGLPMARGSSRVGKTIGKIGKAARVQVNAETGKSASAHDLRRAFGFRWSRRVMPPQLKELMRHANIETTMTYYVGQDAESTAQELWAALGHKLGHMADRPIRTPLETQ